MHGETVKFTQPTFKTQCFSFACTSMANCKRTAFHQTEHL